MNRIWTFLRGLNWYVLFAVPVLALLLGLANNLRVPEEKRVRWSDEPPGEGARDGSDGSPGEGAQDGAEEEQVEVVEDEQGNVVTLKGLGTWTSDFDAATNAAAVAHVPVVVVVTQKGCAYCARLHKVLKGKAVRDWQRERGWYFVMAARESNPRAADFVVSTPVTNTVAPYVGVYWTRADGTQAMRNFPGREGRMGVRKEKTLALEWMRAVEAAVPDAPMRGVSADSIVRGAKIRLKVAADKEGGADGQVTMSPHVTFLKEGKKADLTAKPKQGSVLAGWRCPDGRFVCGKSRLTVDTSWPEGTYTAVFRRPENCAAPTLHLPGQEVAWTEGQPEKLTLRVNADAYPVTFSCKGLPSGMFLTSRTGGVVSGRPLTNGVFRVEVKATGASPNLPAATGAFTVRVSPGGTAEDAADDGKGDTKEDDEVD